jgi:hypothetical protein
MKLEGIVSDPVDASGSPWFQPCCVALRYFLQEGLALTRLHRPYAAKEAIARFQTVPHWERFMKRAAITTLALFFACSTAAIAQYEDRGAANTTYGQQTNGQQSRDGHSFDQSQAYDGSESKNPYYRDRGKQNSTYGQTQAQNYNYNSSGSRRDNGYGPGQPASQARYNSGSSGANNTGDRYANQTTANGRSDHQGDHYRSTANNQEFGSRHSGYTGDQRYGGGYAGRYHTAYQQRRHCVWHYHHRACYR